MPCHANYLRFDDNEKDTKAIVSCRLSNKDVLIMKEKILHCLTDDFKDNQAIFDKKQGWAVFNGTNLEMVMDCVVKGLKFAQGELNGG